IALHRQVTFAPYGPCVDMSVPEHIFSSQAGNRQRAPPDSAISAVVFDPGVFLPPDMLHIGLSATRAQPHQ
ncbi:hypothetical protein OSK12_25280, partial [Escherichia coli]|nr:hypothetical protein [Escherichia coli]